MDLGDTDENLPELMRYHYPIPWPQQNLSTSDSVLFTKRSVCGLRPKALSSERTEVQ